ncbi:MAG: hypothetical protein ACXW12_18405 [Burkholderiales bacterium]
MSAESDRRTHTRLREVFAEAIALIEPLFRQDTIWSNVSLEYCAQRVLRDRYPELDMMDIYVFVVVAKRVYADRRQIRQPASAFDRCAPSGEPPQVAAPTLSR